MICKNMMIHVCVDTSYRKGVICKIVSLISMFNIDTDTQKLTSTVAYVLTFFQRDTCFTYTFEDC